MQTLSIDEYLTKRVDDQMEWLSNKSASNQKAYNRLRMLELLAAALIALLSGQVNNLPQGALILGVLGSVVGLVAGALSLFKFHENWLRYRVAAEALKHERFMYLTRSGPYARPDADHTLVERVEKLLMKENAAWEKTGQPSGTDASKAPSPTPNPASPTPSINATTAHDTAATEGGGEVSAQSQETSAPKTS